MELPYTGSTGPSAATVGMERARGADGIVEVWLRLKCPLLMK